MNSTGLCTKEEDYEYGYKVDLRHKTYMYDHVMFVTGVGSLAYAIQNKKTPVK